MSSAELSDEDYEYEEPKQSSKKKRNPPSEPRKLMRWNPDTDQLALLAVEAVCGRLSVAIPWDEVAKEVAPFLTGEGMKQHLAKLRLARETAGRKVPVRSEKGMRKKTQTKVKEEGDDDEATQFEQPKATNKLAGLLYHGPETQPKRVRTPRKPKLGSAAATPGGSTASTGAGRKRAKSTLDREKLLGTPTKSTTGKRVRKSRIETLKEGEGEDEDYEQGTPTKKQKKYTLRDPTNHPVYNQEIEIGEDEEDEELSLAPEDDGEIGDDDYQEDEVGEDDKMEDVAEPKSPFKDTSATPKMPASSESNLVREMMDANPTMYGKLESNLQPQYLGNLPSGIEPNPMQVPFDYGLADYGNLAIMRQEQDPFIINSTPRTIPKIDYLEGIFPQSNVSALRSSLNKTPTAIKDEIASTAVMSGGENRQSKPRKDGNQQTFEMRGKKNNDRAATQFTTPAKQISTPGVLSTPVRQPFGSVSNSPFNTPEQNQAEIDAILDMNSDLGQANYTSAMPLQPPVFPYSNTYGQSARGQSAYGAVMGGSNYMQQYGHAPGMGQNRLHINANDGSALLGGVDMLSSPDDIYMSAHSNANFAAQGGFNNSSGLQNFNNMNHVSSVGNSSNFNFANSARMPQLSQVTGAMPSAIHNSSFDSAATDASVMASQTDETNDNMHLDGGHESQHFDEAMGMIEYKALDEFEEDPFGSTDS